MFGALGNGMPLTMAGSTNGDGFGSGGIGVLALLLLAMRGGFGFGGERDVAGCSPAHTALLSQIGNIEGKVSALVTDNRFDNLPGQTASATIAGLCPELCGIKSGIAALPDKVDLLSSLNRLSDQITNGVTITNTNINSGQNLMLNGFQSLNANIDRGQLAAVSLAQGINSNIDRGFCELTHRLDKDVCGLNANITFQGNRISEQLLAMENARLRDALAAENRELCRENERLVRAEQNALIIGSNNQTQQGLINIINESNNRLSSAIAEQARAIQKNEQTIIQVGNALVAGQTQNPGQVAPAAFRAASV